MADKHEPGQPKVFDTDQQYLGDVYAKALLGFGQKKDKLADLIDELDGVVQGLNAVPKFKTLLESPRIGFSEKEKLIDKAFGTKVSKELMQFLKIVGSKGRFDCLNAIVASAHKLHDELSGRVKATITTAAAIESSVKQEIETKLANMLGKKIQVESKIDPQIIGGMVVRIGDTVYDGSVFNQLNQVRSQAIKGAADAIRSSIERFATTDAEDAILQGSKS